ncbi:uncharacterized protein LOC135391910 isoform X1 [Ornithodoros turicata]|uniref:uncharacterized protein LOC135391910 isoform X1 n=1 Tax=Ornithodoros turicata TaxID=34597 RepID=UPI003138A728
MYTVSKAPNHVFSKSRMLGITPKFASIEATSNGKKLTNGVHENGNAEELSGPKPVFYQVNGRRPHSSARKQQEVVLPQHEELVQYLQNSWSAVCQEYEQAKQQQQLEGISTTVVYKQVPDASTPEFTPCNFERIWADHHYQSIMRST